MLLKPTTVAATTTGSDESVAGPLSLILTSLINWQKLRALMHQRAPDSTAAETGTPATLPFVSALLGTERPFESRSGRLPVISLEEYIGRIEEHSGCTRETIVAALVYIDKVLLLNPSFIITERNIHRVLWTCIVVANKHFEDKYYTNTFYSKVGGVPLLEMNSLEVLLLGMLHFELYISAEQFEKYSEVLSCAVDFCKRLNLGALQQQVAAFTASVPALATSAADGSPSLHACCTPPSCGQVPMGPSRASPDPGCCEECRRIRQQQKQLRDDIALQQQQLQNTLHQIQLQLNKLLANPATTTTTTAGTTLNSLPTNILPERQKPQKRVGYPLSPPTQSTKKPRTHHC
ncbi:Non-receptor tyrosine kinase spore lysis A [Pelomyxa schiedti]|nr:Non-receptor tyrosine kinase spore lysis A [Pelomyxa schiedti]